jgi:hypothetical protein
LHNPPRNAVCFASKAPVKKSSRSTTSLSLNKFLYILSSGTGREEAYRPREVPAHLRKLGKGAIE